MFDFLFIGHQKRLKNRLNVRSFVRYFREKHMKNNTQILIEFNCCIL